jgi:uncharacterized damage-inducible protein DinB
MRATLSVHMTDRSLAIDEVANCLQISHGSAYEIIHNRLGFHKVYSRWVPKQLTVLHKEIRLDICQQQLDRYGKECDAFLDKIISGDETWINHCKLESIQESMEWKHPQSSSKKKFKSQSSARKLAFTIFWDSQVPVLEHYQVRGTTISSVCYTEMLSERIKHEI